MADDKDKPTDTTSVDEAYKGTGKFVSSVGRGGLEFIAGSAAGGVVGGAAAYAGGKNKGKELKKTRLESLANRLTEQLDREGEHFSEAGAAATRREIAEVEKQGRRQFSNGVSTKIGVGVGVILLLHGLYKGWKSANDGKSQFDDLKVEVQDLKTKQALTIALNASSGPAKA